MIFHVLIMIYLNIFYVAEMGFHIMSSACLHKKNIFKSILCKQRLIVLYSWGQVVVKEQWKEEEKNKKKERVSMFHCGDEEALKRETEATFNKEPEMLTH